MSTTRPANDFLTNARRLGRPIRHRGVWSKPLPSGALFDLSDATPGAYLHHRSELGEFVLTSDSAIPTFTKWKRLKAHHRAGIRAGERRSSWNSWMCNEP